MAPSALIGVWPVKTTSLSSESRLPRLSAQSWRNQSDNPNSASAYGIVTRIDLSRRVSARMQSAASR